MFCSNCGKELSDQAAVCPDCDCLNVLLTIRNASPKNRATGTLLCLFFGIFGAHRFYAGKKWTGILQLVTLGGLGVWAFVDFIFLICGKFRDKEGKFLSQ